MTAAVTPGWLFTAYQVADATQRKHFWTWTRWPAFIPLFVAVLVLVALLRDWSLPGLKKRPPPLPQPPSGPIMIGGAGGQCQNAGGGGGVAGPGGYAEVGKGGTGHTLWEYVARESRLTGETVDEVIARMGLTVEQIGEYG